ncbi:unnamed protein product, partial [Ectocarpus sp. 13 AM-2016]
LASRLGRDPLAASPIRSSALYNLGPTELFGYGCSGASSCYTEEGGIARQTIDGQRV